MNRSWSELARVAFERLWSNYENSENPAEYKKYVFEKLLNPYGEEGEHIGYWRAPLIQQRIAKMWNRKERK